ncbi:hypothetical protein [Desulfovibrio litoralis]|uniref:Uncharacterized protein n=1 Tax=Desulfovibrio litoralis DSM 11393 TaxID=1121455 RepID=A0A1M7T3C5_9BACT|nr:hypothetical protein [Desulfovibrio litoralis]SHN65275.1 hypothetical protein SAMN02745728_01508 [Desulfovibrio litoralis DSM 11393]
MDKIEAGALTLSMCTRCNDETSHVIIAVAGNEIVKVECKACGSIHKYRPARKENQKSNTPAIKKVRAGQARENATTVGVKYKPSTLSQTGGEKPTKEKTSLKRTTSSTKNTPLLDDPAWEVAMKRLAVLTPKTYNMNESFGKGDLLSHPSFGLGEVVLLHKPDKIDVLFREGIKRLKAKI